MTSTPTDVVILGGGPAGYSCALRCADLGLRVALVERDEVGGTCLHRGCVPTRAMLHAASLADAAGKPSERWGLESSFNGVDVARLKATRDEVVARNVRSIRHHLDAAQVQLINSGGRLLDARTVIVDDVRVEATRALVLAMGSTPRSLVGMQPDGKRILTSDQALALDRMPKSAIVVGGGAVGCEFSQVWAAFGTQVTMLEIEAHLVPFEDADVGHALARALRRRGIRVHGGAELEGVEVSDDSVVARFTAGKKDHRVSAEVLLLAVGRDPATGGLGLEEAGVALEDGYVALRDWSSLETTVGGVHAVGDLLPPPSLARAHVAFAEGLLVADAISGETVRGIDYKGVPRVTHGIIETACVGLSEDEARAAMDEVEVRSMPLGGVAKGLMLAEPGLVKVIAEKQGPILGIHMVGPHASESVGEAVALTGYGATPAEAAALVHAHPTLSEALMELNLALAGRPLHQR